MAPLTHRGIHKWFTINKSVSERVRPRRGRCGPHGSGQRARAEGLHGAPPRCSERYTITLQNIMMPVPNISVFEVRI